MPAAPSTPGPAIPTSTPYPRRPARSAGSCARHAQTTNKAGRRHRGMSGAPLRLAGPVHAEDAYARQALAGELDRLRAATPNHDRNHTLNRAAFRVYQLAAAGLIDAQTVTAAFTETARAGGLGERETRATLRSARTAARRFPRRLPDPPARTGMAGRRARTDHPGGRDAR